MSRGRQERRVLGRYLLADAIASGGMATIHLGRLLGPVGFARTVAIKRLHPQFAKDPAFVASFLDEARLAARVQHPNVGATLDVVAIEGELFLVMEYVDGESLSHLIRRARKREGTIAPRIAASIVAGALYGLHAAHEARGDDSELLGLVHRDVSPQNILVGVDGVARVVDFGIAKAAQRVQETEVGRIKGKFAYMSPEQVQNRPLDRRSDVFAAGAVLWEVVTCQRLFEDDDPMRIMSRILEAKVTPPSRVVRGLAPELDAVCMRALERDRDKRYPTARDMAIALEKAVPPALTREVGEWVERAVGDVLARRARALSRLQREGSEPSPVASRKELARMLDSGEETVDYPRNDASPGVESTSENATPLAPERSASEESVASFAAAPSKARTTYALAGAIGGAIVFVALVLVVKPPAQGPEPAPSRALVSERPSGELPAPAVIDAAAGAGDAASDAASDAAAPRARRDSGVVRRDASAPVSGKSCIPPYTVDADGIKKYKPWCLRQP